MLFRVQPYLADTTLRSGRLACIVSAFIGRSYWASFHTRLSVGIRENTLSLYAGSPCVTLVLLASPVCFKKQYFRLLAASGSIHMRTAPTEVPPLGSEVCANLPDVPPSRPGVRAMFQYAHPCRTPLWP